MSEQDRGTPAAWHADPAARHQYRYWDGAQWTDWVADDGVQSLDPLYPQGRVPSSSHAATEGTSSLQRGTRTGYLLVGSNGYANTEVAGEFARVDSIHKAIGRKPKLDEEIELTDLVAALVPEPSNPHDRNAVMVQINGQHVGYLEKEDAARYQPVIRQVWDAGFVAATGTRVWVSARESWDSKKLKYVARVTLALNEPPSRATQRSSRGGAQHPSVGPRTTSDRRGAPSGCTRELHERPGRRTRLGNSRCHLRRYREGAEGYRRSSRRWSSYRAADARIKPALRSNDPASHFRLPRCGRVGAGQGECDRCAGNAPGDEGS